MRAADVIGLVLDPGVEASTEVERRYAEAAAVDARDGIVKARDVLDDRFIGKAGGARDVIPVEQRPVADERIRLAAGRPFDARRVDHALDDVVDVVPGTRIRTAQVQLATRRAIATAGTHERGGQCRRRFQWCECGRDHGHWLTSPRPRRRVR